MRSPSCNKKVMGSRGVIQTIVLRMRLGNITCSPRISCILRNAGKLDVAQIRETSQKGGGTGKELMPSNQCIATARVGLGMSWARNSIALEITMGYSRTLNLLDIRSDWRIGEQLNTHAYYDNTYSWAKII